MEDGCLARPSAIDGRRDADALSGNDRASKQEKWKNQQNIPTGRDAVSATGRPGENVRRVMDEVLRRDGAAVRQTTRNCASHPDTAFSTSANRSKNRAKSAPGFPHLSGRQRISVFDPGWA